jgi:hypothetical protein
VFDETDVGVVDPLAEPNFATNGDSGALLYYMESTEIVPLRLLLGCLKDVTPQRILSMGLESWMIEAHRLGLRPLLYRRMS